MNPTGKASRTLLLVDDEPSNLYVLKQILQEDYHLLFARNGEKALELSREKQPDLVLLDVMMPEFSGYDVCRALKQDLKTANIPVVFISALSEINDELQGFAAGAVDYITKPVNPVLVKARVAAHLSVALGEKIGIPPLQITSHPGESNQFKEKKPNKYLGRYEIIEELGRGAMGVVYKAKDPFIDRNVAVKIINLQEIKPDEKEEYKTLFYQEARAAGQLNHPNIVTIHDVGESEGMAYIAMELLEGKELHQLLKNGQVLPLEVTLDIVIQVATGLSYAHKHDIVHRDIKPSNIMVLEDKIVKIADFGIAHKVASKLKTHTSPPMVGSPLYMSPEQVLSKPIDSRTDIFSLGIVLYQMLTGELPFNSDNINSVMYQIVNEAPRKPASLNPEVSDSLNMIVSRCLEKKPEDRYQNAHELADDLRSCYAILLQAQGVFDLNHYHVLSDVMVHTNKYGRLKLAALILSGALVSIGLFELIELLFFDK